jgi:molecular chaperone GrpE
MTKKIEDEKDIPQKQDNDIEIEFLTESRSKPSNKSQPPSSRKTPGDKALRAKLKKMDEKIERLQQENEKYQEEYLRMAADKDNLRKRLEREKEDFLQYALSDLLKDMLNVLDNFERALDSDHGENCKSLREGIELIYKQYEDLLKRQGVSPIETEDVIFDPRVQQAFMSSESSEVEEPTVHEELQKGYMLHDRLLRPALVKVLIPKRNGGDENS